MITDDELMHGGKFDAVSLPWPPKRPIIDWLHERGVQEIILGCTEIPLLAGQRIGQSYYVRHDEVTRRSGPFDGERDSLRSPARDVLSFDAIGLCRKG
jgi:hypothetical protein